MLRDRFELTFSFCPRDLDEEEVDAVEEDAVEKDGEVLRRVFGAKYLKDIGIIYHLIR
jgi:tetrahydromethanopterin S-methyltransferase subunit G